MKNKLRKLCSALVLGCGILVAAACGAGAPPAEEPVPPVEFQTPTPATLDDTLSQSNLSPTPDESQVAPTALPTELVEPPSSLTSTETVSESMTVETVEPTPAELPTELVEPDATVSLPVSPIEELIVITDTSRGIAAGGEESLTAAVADLADRLEIAPEEITLVSMEAQEWSDSSLGCPQEGRTYTPVITPGYLIILEAEGQHYEYHTDQASTAVLCQEIEGAAGNRGLAPGEAGQTPLNAAQADLAAKLGLDPADITLVTMEAVDWPDTSLGCPQEGMMYAQVITPGYLIILEAEGQQYEYHTDQASTVVLCEPGP